MLRERKIHVAPPHQISAFLTGFLRDRHQRNAYRAPRWCHAKNPLRIVSVQGLAAVIAM
jgi:hypothetical protein